MSAYLLQQNKMGWNGVAIEGSMIVKMVKSWLVDWESDDGEGKRESESEKDVGSGIRGDGVRYRSDRKDIGERKEVRGDRHTAPPPRRTRNGAAASRGRGRARPRLDCGWVSGDSCCAFGVLKQKDSVVAW